jgi:hypothetical protein
MRFLAVLVGVLVLVAVPVILGAAVESAPKQTYAETETLTVSNDTSDLTHLRVSNETITQNGSQLNASEDYTLDGGNGTVAWITCDEQGLPDSNECPVAGEPATAAYEWASIDREAGPLVRITGVLVGELGNLGLLVAVVAAVLAGTKQLTEA